MIRVAIIDDHAVVRAGLRQFLSEQVDLSVVAEGVNGLIAAPGGFVEERRSGTWATIRYARQAGRRIWVVKPDGSVSFEAEN